MSANVEVRAATFSVGTLLSAAISSAVSPSVNGSSSASPLVLSNGSTAIDGAAGATRRVAAQQRNQQSDGGNDEQRGSTEHDPLRDARAMGRRASDRSRVGGDGGVLEGAQHLRCVLRPLGRRLCQELHNETPEGRWDIRPQDLNGFGRLGQMRRRQLSYASAGERRRAGKHLVRHQAECVEIRAVIRLGIAERLFRRHVRRCADHQTDRAERFVRVPLVGIHSRSQCLCHTEVGHQRIAIAVEQDVLGLDVPMNDAVSVGMGQGACKIAQQANGIANRQRPARGRDGRASSPRPRRA